jgi:hypothetical protein
MDVVLFFGYDSQTLDVIQKKIKKLKDEENLIPLIDELIAEMTTFETVVEETTQAVEEITETVVEETTQPVQKK